MKEFILPSSNDLQSVVEDYLDHIAPETRNLENLTRRAIVNNCIKALSLVVTSFESFKSYTLEERIWTRFMHDIATQNGMKNIVCPSQENNAKETILH